MATTTNYGWTTPDDTALVKDGAAAIRTLGTSVDTTTKNLNPSTTLGDIEFRSSTANTNTRLGIGATGTVLTVAGGVPTWAAAPSAGLNLISTTTFSGVSSQSVNSVFSSTYDNYFFTLRIDATADTDLNFRMRTGSDDTGSVYGYANYSIDGAGNAGVNSNGNAQSAGRLGPCNSTPIQSYSGVIFFPNVAEVTAMNNTVTMPTNTGTGLNVQTFGGNIVGTSTQYTGITFFPASGTITGSVSIYGYAK